MLSPDDPHNESSWNGRAYHALRYIYSSSPPAVQSIMAGFCPSSTVSCSSAYPAAALLIQATYANGMNATVPLEEAEVTSDSETLYAMNYGRIIVDTAKISADTVMNFTVKWKGMTAQAVLTVKN